MPRGIPNVKPATPQLDAPKQATKPRVPGLETRLRRTQMHHIFHFDIEGDGRGREVAVVKMLKDHTGSIISVRYIDVQLLDMTDKKRIKGLISNLHADKYELWDLMSQTTLSNGYNALDYFHQMVRTKDGAGAVNTQFGGGLGSLASESNAVIGSDFTDPQSGSVGSEGVGAF